MVKPVLLCCLEHVELALDKIVDEFECAPLIHDVQGMQCEFCDQPAKYRVERDPAQTKE